MREMPMFLLEPNQTPYDLRWRMLGTSVRVHPLFWLAMAFFGWNLVNHPKLPGNGLLDLGLWVLCCFVSILLHEFGHVWMGQAFGSHGHIVLYGFGGLAIGSANGLRWHQRVLVSAAGPGIQLLLWMFLRGLVWYPVSPLPLGSLPPALQFLLRMLFFVNFTWALFNLLPIFPLDGGQISRDVCGFLVGPRGVIVSLWISVVAAASVAIYALLDMNASRLGDIPFPAPLVYLFSRMHYLLSGLDPLFLAIFFGLMAFENFQTLQIEKSRRNYWDDDSRWTR